MNPIQRRGFLSGLIAVLLSPISTAFPAQSPSIKAKKLGQTTIFAGKKFTVIRKKIKGKYQLVWNKGVLIPVKSTPSPSATPTPTASATPTPTASATPTPTPTPTPKNLGTLLGDSSALAIGETKLYETKNRLGRNTTYVAYRSSNGVIVMSDICPHAGCAVKLMKEGLLCPCHSSLFNATSGAVLRGPANQPLPRFEALEENGKIYVTD